jgi:hypothetical protein
MFVTLTIHHCHKPSDFSLKLFPTPKVSPLIPFKEMIALYSENRVRPINTPSEQIAELLDVKMLKRWCI